MHEPKVGRTMTRREKMLDAMATPRSEEKGDHDFHADQNDAVVYVECRLDFHGSWTTTLHDKHRRVVAGTSTGK